MVSKSLPAVSTVIAPPVPVILNQTVCSTGITSSAGEWVIEHHARVVGFLIQGCCACRLARLPPTLRRSAPEGRSFAGALPFGFGPCWLWKEFLASPANVTQSVRSKDGMPGNVRVPSTSMR